MLAQLKVLAQKKALQEVTLQTAQEKLRRTKVYAPFSGLVSQLFVHPGTKVSAVPPTKLLRLEETSRLRLRFSLPQRLASHLKPQITIHFRLANSKWRKASATSLGYASPKSRTLFFEGEVPNRERTLLPNMYCEVKLVTAHYPKAFFLPKKALHPASQGGTQIWIKRRGKVFSFQPEILGYQREYVVLEKGLEPDDQVYVLK